MVTPIFPPRPKGAMTAVHLEGYENSSLWVAQRKFNGNRNIIHVENGKVSFFNRHAKPHVRFVPSKSLIEQVNSLNLDPKLSYWLDGELLHEKTKNPIYKNRIVLYDILQAGRYLFGSPTQLVRLQLLNEICGNPNVREPENGIALIVTENIWMAETFLNGFKDRFNDLIGLDEIEGLVLRKRASVLDNTGKKEYNCSWIIRCRKPHKNYNF